MGSDVMLGGRYTDVQDLRFQTAKQSVMGCADLQGTFADCQEWRFQTAKFSDMSRAILQEVHLLILSYRVFRLRIFQIWLMTSCKVVY